ASLASHEVERLFELIERLTARGIAIVYISHRMDEIRRVA
ncbi:MAG TPA: sugar ABC transporter ATP-binding protein, partial [Microbacterium sp.]|nr:sugar ABC transporter ATP-binding protein [Microbacterium sp.]